MNEAVDISNELDVELQRLYYVLGNIEDEVLRQHAVDMFKIRMNSLIDKITAK